MQTHTPDLYVLTDARGFTTAVEGNAARAAREAARIPLLVPITVHAWTLHGNHLGRLWKKAFTYEWDGMVASWR